MPRKIFEWTATSGDEGSVYEMDTEEIARTFSVPLGAHPAIVRISGYETASGAAQNLHAIADPPFAFTDGELAAFDLFEEFGEAGPLNSNNLLFIRAGASDDFIAADQPVDPVHIWNKLIWVKATAANWIIIVDWIYVEQDLDWNSEMAELYDNIRQISPERSAGGQGFQPTGRFRQVGGIGGEDSSGT